MKTEQELRNEFKNLADCWADSDDAIQAMSEDAAVKFAMNHAAEKDAEIARMSKFIVESMEPVLKNIEEGGARLRSCEAANAEFDVAFKALEQELSEERELRTKLAGAMEKAIGYIGTALPNSILAGSIYENYYFAYHGLQEALFDHKKGDAK